MIEIRIDEHAPPATPDGPHSHEQTRAIANGISEAVRLLNYATLPGNDGLRYPSDLYSVLGSLVGMVHALPQALEQMTAWLVEEFRSGYIRGDQVAAHQGVADLEHALRDAAEHAASLGKALARGQSAVSVLASARNDEEGE